MLNDYGKILFFHILKCIILIKKMSFSLLIFKILSEATQKLCLSTGARHLYDFNGKEVFTHEDIQQNKSYYVT